MYDMVDLNYDVYNIHGHIFDFRFVPEKFAPIKTSFIYKNPKSTKRLLWAMRNLNPFMDNMILDKYASFLETMGKTQKRILQDWEKSYPIGTIFSPLAVDLRKMGAGNIQEEYMVQLQELKSIALKSKGRVKPFVMIDPRADDIDELYKFLKINNRWIGGIKMYPLIGYTVTDKRLGKFYKLAEKYGWPIMIHCTPKNAVYYRSNDIDDILPTNFPYYKKARGNKGKCANFAHPWHITQAAKANPNVNFIAAHFGGCSDWEDFLIEAIALSDNIYTDTSFTFNERKEQKHLKFLLEHTSTLKDKVLFGDDAYMIKTLDVENPFYAMKDVIGEELFKQIAYYNPRKVLGCK